MDKRKTPSTISEVTTPCFLVDLDRLKNNAKRMLDTCRQLKVDLRPHTKTHKTVEAAEISTDGTRRKITCSTLPECEMFADSGFDDILLAYPITADKIPRCAQLTNRLEEFHVMVSGEDGVQCLKEGASALGSGKRWSVFLEVDCGLGRTGLASDGEALLRAARRVHEDVNIQLRGLYTFCGMSYSVLTPEQRKKSQKKLADDLLGAAERIRAAGIEVPMVGTGSTPTCSRADSILSRLDEFHPGNYVFYDYEQVLLGSCTMEDIACCVATRVVCHMRDLNTLVVDGGFLAISHDGRKQRGDDFCTIKDHPHLRITSMDQELSRIVAKEGESINFDHYPVGTMLFVYPFHSCATAAMYDQYLVHSGQKIVGCWKPVRGW